MDEWALYLTCQSKLISEKGNFSSNAFYHKRTCLRGTLYSKLLWKALSLSIIDLSSSVRHNRKLSDAKARVHQGPASGIPEEAERVVFQTSSSKFGQNGSIVWGDGILARKSVVEVATALVSLMLSDWVDKTSRKTYYGLSRPNITATSSSATARDSRAPVIMVGGWIIPCDDRNTPSKVSRLESQAKLTV
jgi:hypothetical protein